MVATAGLRPRVGPAVDRRVVAETHHASAVRIDVPDLEVAAYPGTDHYPVASRVPFEGVAEGVADGGTGDTVGVAVTLATTDVAAGAGRVTVGTGVRVSSGAGDSADGKGETVAATRVLTGSASSLPQAAAVATTSAAETSVVRRAGVNALGTSVRILARLPRGQFGALHKSVLLAAFVLRQAQDERSDVRGSSRSRQVAGLASRILV